MTTRRPRPTVTPSRRRLAALKDERDALRKALTDAEAARDAERRRNQIFEQAPVGIFFHPLIPGQSDGFVSSYIERCLGYSVAEWFSEPDFWERRLHPDDRQRVLDDVAAAVASGQPLRHEYRLRHRDGHYLWLFGEARLLTDAHGAPHAFQGFFYDSSARKAAEAEARSQERLYRSLTENLPDVLVRLDRDGRILYASPNVEHYFGFPPAVLLGRTALDVGMPPETFHGLLALIGAVVATGEVQTLDLPAAPPLYQNSYEARLIPEWGANGAVATVMLLARDVTEQRATAAALRESEARLRVALDAGAMVAWEWNLAADQVTWVGDLVRTLEIAPQAELDMSALTRTATPDELERMQAGLASLAHQDEMRIEHRYPRADGSIGWLESYARVTVRTPQGPAVLVGVSRQITRRKQLEDELLRQARLQGMLARSLQILHHDGHDAAARRAVLAAVMAEMARGLTAARVLLWANDEQAGLRLVADSAELLSPGETTLPLDLLSEDARDRLQRGVPVSSREAAPLDRSLAGGGTAFELLPLRWPGVAWGLVAVALAAGAALTPEELTAAVTLVELAGTTLRRWQASDELAARERQLRLAMEAAQQGTFELELATEVVQVSRRLAQLAGLGDEEQRVPMAQFVARLHPDDRDDLLAALAHALESGEAAAFEGRVQQQDGSYRWVRSLGLPLLRPDGQPERLVGVAMDVTEAREARETLERVNADLERRVWKRTHDLATALEQRNALNAELQQSDRLLRTIINSLDDALILLDARGQALLLNRAMATLCRRDPEELAGRSWREISPFDLPALNQALEQGLAFRGRERLALGDEVRVFDLQAIPLTTAAGERQLVLHLVDLTERLQFEELALNNERLAATGRLAAVVAHEVNSPLQAIQNLLFLAAAEELAERTAALTMIGDEINRVSGLIRSLLDLHRPGDSAARLVDLDALIAKVLTLTGSTISRYRVRAEYEPADGAVVVRGRSDQMTQVLLNLVMNALDVMPHGGELRVRAYRFEGHEPGSATPQGLVLVEVEDTGPGVPAELLNRIFEPFFTTKASGSGLGLAISRQIVEQHGGALTVANVPPRGACFRVVLPTVEPEAGNTAVT